MKACAICDDQTSLLSCPHVGAICFDCWGCGIHEVLKRKKAEWQKVISKARAFYRDSVHLRKTIDLLSPVRRSSKKEVAS